MIGYWHNPVVCPRLRNDLLCVEWDVKLYTLTHSPVHMSVRLSVHLSVTLCIVALRVGVLNSTQVY